MSERRIDVYLSNYAREVRNDDYIAHLIAPEIPVPNQSDHYVIWGEEALDTDGDDVRLPTQPSTRLRKTLTKDTFHVEDHSKADLLEDELDEPPGPESQVAGTVRTLKDNILLRREKRVLDLLADSANYAAGHTIALTGNDRWDVSAHDDADPFEDVWNAKDQIFPKIAREPNTLVIGRSVARALRRNEKVKADVGDVKLAKNVTLQMLREYFEIPNVWIAPAIQRDAAGNKALTFDKKAVLMYVNPQARTEADISALKTFRWINAPNARRGHAVLRGREGLLTSQQAEEISVHDWHTEKVVGPAAMYLIDTVVS